MSAQWRLVLLLRQPLRASLLTDGEWEADWESGAEVFHTASGVYARATAGPHLVVVALSVWTSDARRAASKRRPATDGGLTDGLRSACGQPSARLVRFASGFRQKDRKNGMGPTGTRPRYPWRVLGAARHPWEDGSGT